MLLFIVIIALAAVVAYFVVNGTKKPVHHVEDIKIQSTVLPVEEPKKKVEPVKAVAPIAEVQKAEPKKKSAPKKKVVKSDK